MKLNDNHKIIAVAVLALAAAGCPPRQELIRPAPPPPRPLVDAIQLVNQNSAKVTSTLRAIGDVDGQFRDAKGVLRHYSLDGTMFYLPPNYFRFSLKSLGDTKFIMGSNDAWYWFLDPNDRDNNHCARQNGFDELPTDVPMRPDQVVDALGLRAIPVNPNQNEFLVQRVEGEYQQILFVARPQECTDATSPVIVKEYWIDLRHPNLISRVIFRDRDGVVEMDARLTRHSPLTATGPLLPTECEATWPKQEASLRIRIHKWSAIPEVLSDSAQFETPPECLQP